MAPSVLSLVPYRDGGRFKVIQTIKNTLMCQPPELLEFGLQKKTCIEGQGKSNNRTHLRKACIRVCIAKGGRHSDGDLFYNLQPPSSWTGKGKLGPEGCV